MTGQEYVIQIFHSHYERCYDSFRPEKCAFVHFCGDLKQLGYLWIKKCVFVYFSGNLEQIWDFKDSK